MSDAALLALLLGVMNLVAFAAFGIDKHQAHIGGWRISERQLLLAALLGGTIGAYLGRRWFRHKTRKRSFSAALHLIALLQVAALAWLWTQPAAHRSIDVITMS